MCLIVLSYKNHKKYPFIFTGNRDEFYDRPAKKAYFWETEPPILAGRDLKAGGTWAGISRRGVFGAVTNYRDLKNIREKIKSRGELIPRLLTREDDFQTILKSYIRNGDQYDGFNLIAGDIDDMYYISNISNSIQNLNPGLYGISNAFLNTPWPKVDVSKSEFEQIISGTEIDEEAIFKLLQNRQTYPLDSLPETGLSPEMEKAVSPIFIETENYGTRCSTLILIDNHGLVTFVERTYPINENQSESEKRFQFRID